jgi:hypothetical protein
MLILICLATHSEANACKKGLQKSGQSKSFEILQTGMGFQAAFEKLEERLKTGPKPQLIVSSGFCGGVAAHIKLGTWAWGSKLNWNHNNTADLEPLPLPVLKLPLLWEEAIYESVSAVTLHQNDQLSPSTEAVDMESEAWFTLAAQNKIPFSILRLASDTKDHPLPKAIKTFSNAILEPDWQKKLSHCWLGSREVLENPKYMGRFIFRSTSLLRKFSDGWRSIFEVWVGC